MRMALLSGIGRLCSILPLRLEKRSKRPSAISGQSGCSGQSLNQRPQILYLLLNLPLQGFEPLQQLRPRRRLSDCAKLKLSPQWPVVWVGRDVTAIVRCLENLRSQREWPRAGADEDEIEHAVKVRVALTTNERCR